MNEIRNVGDWLKVADLGSGAFGVVSLWRNEKTNESVGKLILLIATNIGDNALFQL